MTNKSGYEKKYFGIIPPLVTPLFDDETLDEESFARLINYCIDNGVNGIFPMGSSGEAMCTSKAVWKKTIEVALKTAGNRVPVFCGVIDTCTERVIENIKEVEKLGGKTVVVTPAFYLQNTCQDEIVRHYEKVCASTDLEVVVYNIPPMTHVNILPETIAKLAEIKNVVAFKDSCANWEQFQRNLFLLEDSKISVFNGAEELCSASLIYGADGCVPGLANFFPKLFVDLYKAAQNKDIKQTYELQKTVWEIRKTLSVGKSWMSAMKYMSQKFGFGTDRATTPVEPLTDADKKKIDEILARYM